MGDRRRGLNETTLTHAREHERELTETQWRALRLIAAGKTNAQIAEALEMTLDGAKWHVSEILTKLGLSAREDAADYWHWRQSARQRLGRALGGLTGIASWRVATGAAGAALALAGAAVVATLLLRSGEENGLVLSPATPTATPPRGECPVDPAICEFAKEAEYELQEGDPGRLISPKSQWAADAPGVVTGLLGGDEAATRIRVFSIGCPTMAASTVDCSQYFSLVFTKRAEGDELGGGPFSRELLAFRRDGADLPVLTVRAAVPAISELVSGGVFGRCYATEPEVGLPGCAGTAFHPYTTGPALLVAPTPTPEPLPASDPLAGHEVIPLTAGAEASLGHGTVIYYSTGCFGCGRPLIPNLFRAYRDATGQLITDDLFGPLLARTGGYPDWVAADWERGHILVKVCATGSCGGEGDPSSDASIRLFRSRDGGVTFSEEDASGFPVGSSFHGLSGDEAIVRAYERKGQGYVERFFLYPSRTPLAPPSEAGRSSPVADSTVGVGWLNWDPGNGYFDSDAKLLVAGGAGKRLVRVVPLPGGGRLATWLDNTAQFLGVYDQRGQLVGVVKTDEWVDLRGQAPTGLLYGTVQLAEPFAFEGPAEVPTCKQLKPVYASMTDWRAGTIHPLSELGGCAPNHMFPNAIVARVPLRVATDGDCLHVRREPSASSESLGCFADGVLLGARGDGQAGSAGAWRAVVTPSLEPGWAAAQYLVD